jgi:microcystin-dependent protein
MEPFLGEIKLLSFNFAPKGWAMCNGAFLAINQNQALFALLGTQFGGNGQTTFALPDLRDRVPVHLGGWMTSVGQRGGEAAHTLTANELPQHTHMVGASSSSAGGSPSPTGGVLGAIGDGYHAPASTVALRAGTIANVGGSQAHTNQQPFLTLMFCIALQGIFPSVN